MVSHSHSQHKLYGFVLNHRQYKLQNTCSMFKLSTSRVLRISPQFINSFCTLVDPDDKINRLLSHVYRKTWTKNQLIDYIKENVVFESNSHIVTSLPQGVALKKTSRWVDTVTPLSSEADLNEILRELPAVFNTDTLFLTVYPRCNASGLTIISKSYEDRRYIKKNLILATSKNKYSYSFLAVVLGCPEKNLTKTFGLRPNKVEADYSTEVLSQWNNPRGIQIVKYKHRVLTSTPLASLVEVKVTRDARDCVRHILGTRCLTPVLGDIWNCLKNNSSFMGAPLLVDPAVVDVKSVLLNRDLLAKLNLQPGDENIIPIHVHFHSLFLTFKNQTDFFVSVPPPESFVWTCHQLGLDEIKNYERLK